MCSTKYKNSYITAIDLSASSLSYAKRKADEYGVKNINFIHSDLLDVENLTAQWAKPTRSIEGETFGKLYEKECYIHWCKNIITVFDFHVGHDIPESKGGTLDIENLKPICARCNQSMGNNYSIQEWQNLTKKNKRKCISCF